MDNKPVEINLPTDGAKTADDLATLQDLLKKEAIEFLEGNAAELFVLGKETVNAILFKQVNTYVSIPPLSPTASLQEILDRETILTARDSMFQLVAKAELEHYQAVETLKGKAETLALSLVEKVGMAGVSYLLKMLVSGMV